MESLRVGRKYVAGWAGVPWTKGRVPWPVVVPGSLGDWRYYWKEFGARRLWLSRHFIRDADLKWVTDNSGAEDVDEKSGTPNVQFDMEVPRQGVKRTAPPLYYTDVSVSRGLGAASCVPIPQDSWCSIAAPLASPVVFNVEVPRKELRSEELAMIEALVH